MNRNRHAAVFLALTVASLVSGACGSGPAAEKPSTSANDAHPAEKTSRGSPSGEERTTVPGERPVLSGIVTGERRSTFEGEPVLRITVEENPDARCPKGPTTPGCEKMIFTINDETRVSRDEGCDGEGVEGASAADLAKGQRVRADHTGHGVAESYPGQTTARSVVICSTPSGPTVPEPSHETEVFFPKQPQKTNAYMMAEFRGELLLDERGCLRVRWPGHGSVVPVWPPGFEAEASGGHVSVLDGRGRIVGRVGEPIYMGGGEVPPEGGNDQEMVRELRERCPGNYWLAAPEVRILRQD
jgi:hypothetical protein